MVGFLSGKMSVALKSLITTSVIVLALLVLQPFLWKMVQNRAEVLHEKRTQAEQIEEVRRRIENIQENYDSQRIFIEQLTSVIPQSRDALQVIERLETASQGLDVLLEVSRIDEGLPLRSVEDLQETDETEARSVAEESATVAGGEAGRIFPLYITLTVTGVPEVLIEYIDAIEHVQELSRIQKFTLSPAVSEEEQLTGVESRNFQLLMTVIFYLQGSSDGESS